MEQAIKICKTCVLNERIPSVRFDEGGICNFCRQAKGKRDKKKLKERYAIKFSQLLSNYKSHGGYECLVAFSGGKDSSYTLQFMKNEYKLNILALSFDNWFQSESAIKNIHTVIKSTGVDHITVLPSFEAFKRIIHASLFHDIYPMKALERASAICTTCLSLIRFVCIRTAIEKDIPFVIFGMSPGQAPIATSLFKTNVEMIRKMQNAIFHPLRNYTGNLVDKYYLEAKYFERKDSLPYIINPLAFIEYDEKKIYDQVTALGWQAPDDTDPNSTNCLLNAFANQVHLQNYGYHPYAMEMAELVRQGILSREDALHRLAQKPDQEIIEMVKEKLDL